jgi:hypothetical protein
LVYLSILLFQNSYIILFWEFYFLPFSVNAQTTVIYLIHCNSHITKCVYMNVQGTHSVQKVLFIQFIMVDETAYTPVRSHMHTASPTPLPCYPGF